MTGRETGVAGVCLAAAAEGFATDDCLDTGNNAEEVVGVTRFCFFFLLFMRM